MIPSALIRRPSFGLALAVTLLLLAATVLVRLVVFPDRLVPLAYSLPLLVVLWHRDLRLLWLMSGVFLVVSVIKFRWFVPADAFGHLYEPWLFGGMQWSNILVPAAVLHVVENYRDGLERSNAALALANAELEASNEELAAREEEIVQQNEELQVQAEELEQQTEELRAQAEELQMSNHELAAREHMLEMLLQFTGSQQDDQPLGDRICAAIADFFGDEAQAAMMLMKGEDGFAACAHFGVKDVESALDDFAAEATLATLIMERNQTGQLEDAQLRPDLRLPRSARGVPFRSALCAPVRCLGEPIGVLEVYAEDAHSWTARQVHLVTWLANQYSQALENVRLKQQALEAQRRAEAASEAKSQFLANMSHELRTPMNAILGMTELALQEPLPDGARDCLVTAKESAEFLLELVNEILDLSRIEAGKLKLETVEFQLRSTLQKTLHPLAIHAQRKQLGFFWSVPDDVPDRLTGDSLRFRQVIANLVGNAVKFTNQGQVDLRIRVVEQSLEEICLEFAVSDTGIGIADGKLQHIFAPFTQGDSSTTRQFGGTGLGLSIAARLVELMGGTIRAESQVGAGSTFYFTARFRVSLGPELAPTLRPDVSVLVVDDDQATRRTVEQILNQWQMESHCVADVSAAMAKLHEVSTRGATFPVVLAGAHLAGIDGFATAEWFQNGPQPAGRMILMLPAAEKQSLLRRCETLGAAYVEKPIAATSLLTAILGTLRQTAPQTPQKHPPCQEDPIPAITRPLRVLLAEDTPANQKLVVLALTKRGHQVEVASNGRHALELLQQQNFDVVLMDVQMPDMDGFQATRQIRQHPLRCKARVPIIAMTAHALQGDRERCLSAGMDGYVSKPVNPGKLIQVVETHAQAEASDSAEDVAPPREPGPAMACRYAAPAFDLQEAVKKCCNSYEAFQEMVECFFDEVETMLPGMRAALERQEADQLARLAHRLKGTVCYLGMPGLQEAVRRLEHHAGVGRLDDAAPALEALEDIVGPAKEILVSHRRTQPA